MNPNQTANQSHENEPSSKMSSVPEVPKTSKGIVQPPKPIPKTDPLGQALFNISTLSTSLPKEEPGSTQNTNVSPAIAEDVDVIEKEWVDKAESIIEATKNDPFEEEEQVETLQLDYLDKRYNHKVDKPQER